jgi:hypothetical protein
MSVRAAPTRGALPSRPAPPAVAGAVLLACGLAWLALLTTTVRGRPTMAMHHQSETVDPWTLGWLAMWLLMVVAMMWPLALPTLAVVRRSSYPRWRVRLVLVTVATVTALWVGFGLVAASVARLVSVPEGSGWWRLMFLALAIAAWRSARRTRLLWKCVKLPPVAPGGRRGLVTAARAGVASWRRCGVLCGPVMLAMAVGHEPVVMLCASLSAWWEAAHPRAWRDRVPLLLLGVAALWVAGSLVVAGPASMTGVG